MLFWYVRHNGGSLGPVRAFTCHRARCFWHCCCCETLIVVIVQGSEGDGGYWEKMVGGEMRWTATLFFLVADNSMVRTTREWKAIGQRDVAEEGGLPICPPEWHSPSDRRRHHYRLRVNSPIGCHDALERGTW